MNDSDLPLGNVAPEMNGLLEALSRIVGDSYVLFDQETREWYARSTAPQSTEPLAVVKPSSREQVQAIVRLASNCRVSLFPISRGNNWGYGDACAPRARNLIIDLSRMNRIVEVNPDLAYAVIEPGVTQGQLSDYIREHRLALMMDATAAGCDASIVGNVLERGFGHTPYGNRFLASCNYEVVLSDGSVIETGSGAYENSHAKHAFAQGIGPVIQGLFSQSNLGIVTRMTVWLMPQPEKLCMFVVMLKNRDSVGPFFEIIRRLRLTGTLRSTLHCFNDGRLLSSVMHYPWNLADGRKPFELEFPGMFRDLCRTYCIPAWTATGSLQGTKGEVSAARNVVRRALLSTPGIMGLIFLQGSGHSAKPRSVKYCWRDVPPNWRRHTHIDQFTVGWDLLQGFPSNRSLLGSHWRARIQNNSVNPLDDQSGLVWVSPILPMTRPAVEEVTQQSETVVHKFGFEFQISLTAITDRALLAVQSISFDKSNVDETSRARKCHDELLRTLLDLGYVPYRGALPTLQQIWKRTPSYWNTVARLKQAWDPDGVFAPDRYIPAIVS